MPTVKVVTDSLADIPPEISKELDITVVPCIVRFGDEEFRDRVDLPLAEFYRRLVESPVLPMTSQPPVSVFTDVYRTLAQTTDQIISIHVSGSLSGTLNSANLGARYVPNVKIEVVDSWQASMGLGWLVILAARAAREGYPLRRVRAIVEGAMSRTHIVAMLDTLEYAQRGGRLGKGAALVGATLSVKPLLSVVQGEVEPVEKVRTAARALERLVEITLGSGPIQELAVIHAAAPEYARQLQQKLAATFPEEQIVMSETGPVLGTHTGPGAVGIAWVTSQY